MIEYVEEDIMRLVAVRITKKLDQKDIKGLIPEIERKITQCGKINLYLEIGDEVDWDENKFWTDLNFNLKHAQDIRKVAFVGDEEKEEKIINLLKPLENAERRWYTKAESKDAFTWLKAG